MIDLGNKFLGFLAISKPLSVRWLFLIALLPGLMGGVLQFYWGYQDKRADLEERALHTARALSLVVDTELTGITRNLHLLATSRTLQDGNFEGFYSRARQFLATESLVGAVVLIDENGQQIVNTLRPWGATLPKTGTPGLVQKVIRDLRVSNSDLYIGGTDKQPYVAVGVPVVLKEQRYALVMGIQVKRLALFLAQQQLDEGWVAALIDSKGAIIARNVNHDAMVGKPSRPELMALIAESEEGTMASRTLEGRPSFLAYHRSRSSGWSVAVAMPREVVPIKMYWTITAGILAILGSLITGFVLAGALSRRIQTAINNLAAVTTIAARGDINASAPITGPGEIVELAQRFNDLQASRREMQAQQERIKHHLLLLNESNTAILLANDEGHLLFSICQSIVETGGYSVAWVGLAEGSEEKSIKPVAFHGVRQLEQIDNISLDFADNPSAGIALRTGQPVIDRNVQVNSTITACEDAGAKRCAQTSIALPLSTKNGAFGTLSIYAPASDAFSPEEVSLLERLTNNLSLGLERLRVGHQLAIVNQELQAFTYAASHDMKAPLQRISVFSGMLEKALKGRLDESELTMFGFIKENTARIIQLIDDLLDHAQIEHVAVVTEELNLKEAIQAVLAEKNAEIESIGASLYCAVPDLKVQANSLTLSQVLRNVVGNALKYSSGSNPPIIQIGASTNGKTCCLWVQDNGIGFDMAYHDSIFEIFRRLHTHAEFPGTGVGLAIARKAMERMGGRIWAKSTPENGAVFYIELPLARFERTSGVQKQNPVSTNTDE